MANQIPSRVQELAKQVSGTPLDWKEHENGDVVIVFTDGRKLTFVKASAQSAESTPPLDKPKRKGAK
jgi:hypothetical protein